MKQTTKYMLVPALALLALLSTLNSQLSTVLAQATAFTYQGRLVVGGNPSTNGFYDFQFQVFDAPAGGNSYGSPNPNTLTGVGVTNGLFTVTLDFGAGVFTGPARWLQISARTNGVGSYTTLSPRQALTPEPYAIMANSTSNLLGTLSAAQLSGTVPLAQLPTAILTNNETGVVFGSLTLNGNLNLPATSGSSAGVISVGGTRFFHNYGNWNTFMGLGAGNFTMTGNNNTASGEGALQANTGGNGNTADGAWSLNNNTNGSFNTACGQSALSANTSGQGNTASGYEALYDNTTGINNTANGALALYSNTNGTCNTASGISALYYNTSGSSNTACGGSALYNNTTGNYNTANGFDALYNNTSGLGNEANGYQALQNNTVGHYNTANGLAALQANTTGNGNTANGLQALCLNTNGGHNTANGLWSLLNNSSGSENTADGDSALGANTTGGNNTAIGAFALQNNTTGSGNVALGYQAGLLTAGSYNIALGYQAGSSATGNNNIDIGNYGSTTDNNIIRIGSPGTHTATYLVGTVTVPVLAITGGSDVAEPFDLSSQDIPKGAVVVIDEQNPGRLKLSERAYDTRVAGIVSGANGINPGLTLSQQQLGNSGRNVALSGRVYALADASNGPINPGDLLTSSATPGHAMKVADHTKAQGAILGKAMSGLKAGKGMVLVLVTLQ